MKKLEIGPHETRRTPDGEAVDTWDTLDGSYEATYRCEWGKSRLPIEDATYDWVHASHVLEHIPWWQTMNALTEVYRILKFGGRFTVWVPDGVKIVKFAEEDPDLLLHLERDWAYAREFNPDRDPWIYENARLFWGHRPGEVGQFQHFHRAIFGEKSLKRLLTQAGFSDIKLLERDTTIDPGHGWMEVGMEGFR